MVKAHGYAGRGVVTRLWNKPNDTFSQIEKTSGNAILLIRNPYNAIFGFRNHVEGGHFGHANLSEFIGVGNITFTYLRNLLTSSYTRIIDNQTILIVLLLLFRMG